MNKTDQHLKHHTKNNAEGHQELINSPSVSSSTTVRHRLTRDLTLLVLLLIALFLSLSYFYAKQIQQDITQSIISSTQNTVIAENQRLFDPINNNLILSRKWAELEALTPDKQNTFNKRFIPILETLPQISSVMIASSKGDEYFLSREGENWLSRHINNNKYGQHQAQWQQWNGNNQSLKKWLKTSDYNPLNRPWYQLALSTHKDKPIKWTSPYTFYTLQIPGITGVTSWQDSEGVRFVLAFDITLSEVAKTLSHLKVSKENVAYIMSPKGEVILPPGNKHIIQGSSHLGSLYVPGDANSNYVIFDSVNHWLKKQRKLNHTLSFSREGQLWWYKIFSLESYHNSIYAGIIVPEKNLWDIISDNISFILLGIGLLIILALTMAKFLVKKYAHQLKDVPITSISIDDFSNEVSKLLNMGESETLEFKSTMRKNIKSNRFGKEIELAWLKGIVGFMNTNGGIVLLGVDDDANILGLEKDEFENDDHVLLHFKNLLNQHIGLEFSGFINPIIGQIEEKTILAIECERANRPAFLRNKNTEDFYIRSGPASVKLRVSEVLKYVRDRY